ncbi:MAG: ComEC/Rec2 family competence protein, partial [Pseudomonadota bacterium]
LSVDPDILEQPFLFVPWCLAIGITAYFAGVTSAVFPAVALTSLLLLAGRSPAADLRYAGSLLILAFAVTAVGYAASYSADARRGQPVLTQKVGPVSVVADIMTVEPRSARGDAVISVSIKEAEKAPGLEGHRFRLLLDNDHETPFTGSTVAFRSIFFPPPQQHVPNGYEPAFWRYFQGYSGGGKIISEIETVSGPSGNFSVLAEHVRLGIRDRILSQMGSETGSVATAITTGFRGDLSEETKTKLRHSGLAHILAISGLHMSLMAGGVFFASRLAVLFFFPTRVSTHAKQIAAAIAIVAATAYFSISGGAVSAERAFIMIVIVFTAILFGRPAITLRNVAIAATILLLIKPHMLFSVGFQMSFAATAALVAGYDRLRRSRHSKLLTKLATARGANKPLASVALILAGLMVTSLLAGFATAPFAAFHFNQAAPYGLVGNLLAMPIFSFVVMPLAAISLMLMPVGLEFAPLWLMDHAIRIVIDTAAWVTALDGAAMMVDQLPVLFMVGGILIAYLIVGARRVPIFLLLAIATVSLVLADWRKPNLFVSTSGATVALTDDNGRLVTLSSRPNRYAIDRWAKTRGLNLPRMASEHAKAQCDDGGCAHQLASGTIIAYVTDPRSVRESCDIAQIVIVRFRVSRRLRAECSQTAELVTPQIGKGPTSYRLTDGEGGHTLDLLPSKTLHRRNVELTPWPRRE